jgi:hypothetical protein
LSRVVICSPRFGTTSGYRPSTLPAEEDGNVDPIEAGVTPTFRRGLCMSGSAHIVRDAAREHLLLLGNNRAPDEVFQGGTPCRLADCHAELEEDRSSRW